MSWSRAVALASDPGTVFAVGPIAVAASKNPYRGEAFGSSGLVCGDTARHI